MHLIGAFYVELVFHKYNFFYDFSVTMLFANRRVVFAITLMPKPVQSNVLKTYSIVFENSFREMICPCLTSLRNWIGFVLLFCTGTEIVALLHRLLSTSTHHKSIWYRCKNSRTAQVSMESKIFAYSAILLGLFYNLPNSVYAPACAFRNPCLFQCLENVESSGQTICEIS